MNAADGMTDEEIDCWGEIFYIAKLGGVIDISFSKFLQQPFTTLSGSLPQSRDVSTPQKQTHLRLVQSEREK